MTDKELLIKKYRTLSQYKDKTEEELSSIADKKLEEKELLSEFAGLNKVEKEKALNLYGKYISEKSFEHFAEKNTLMQIVYLEVFGERIKRFIEEESKNKNGAIPINMVETLHSNNEQVIKLKDQLGMLNKEEANSWTLAWNSLKKKALKYYEENGCTTVKCPNCQELFNMLMDTTNLVPTKATFFLGTTLYNRELFKMFHEKRITLEEMTVIFGVSDKYISLIYEQLFLNGK